MPRHSIDLAMLAGIALLLVLGARWRVRPAITGALAVAGVLLSRLAFGPSSPVAVAAEAGAFCLLLIMALRENRRFPLAMAAFALIAVVSSALALFRYAMADWQHEAIVTASWVGATLALAAGVLRHGAMPDPSGSQSR